MDASRDPMGDRFKGYEIEARQTLAPRSLTVIRLDGRAFHTWTRGLQRPYDLEMIEAMAQTTLALCAEVTGTVLAYTQSDEISMIVQDFAQEETQPWFGGQVQKTVSVAAAVATAAFNSLFDGRPPALFDARVFQVPSRVEAANYLVWRQRDAQRNAISMLAEHHFSSKSLHGLSTAERRQRLVEEAGVDLDAQDSRFMHGQLVERVPVTEEVTYTDKRTGEEHTTGPVTRHVWTPQSAPMFSARPGEVPYDLIPVPPAELAAV